MKDPIFVPTNDKFLFEQNQIGNKSNLMEAYMGICWYIPKKVFATFVVPSFLVHVMVFYNMDYVFFIEISINTPTLASSIACW
jgi:hypothetical protein